MWTKRLFRTGSEGVTGVFRLETRSHAADSTGKTGGVRDHNLLNSHTGASTVDAMAAAVPIQTQRELTS